MNSKGFRRKRLWRNPGIIPGFGLEGRRKTTTKKSVTIAGVPADIQTEHTSAIKM
jgi:hypothetical protein